MARSTGKVVEAPVARASNRFSAELIGQLVRAGHTQSGIARMIGVTRSYISRVASGQRALTIEHLAKIEQSTGKPTALLLLEGVGESGDARERERLRELFSSRPSSVEDATPLSDDEQEETDRLSKGLDATIGQLSRACQPKPAQAKAAVSRLRVIKLLTCSAGLSPAAARKVYDVQSRFAAKEGLKLFGT